MTQKRPLDLEDVKQRRANGETWESIAKALNWSLPWLRRRALEEGLLQAQQPLSIPDRQIHLPEKKGIDWDLVAQWFKAGITIPEAAAALGKTPESLKKAYKRGAGDLEALRNQSLARGKAEMALARFNMALAGDKFMAACVADEMGL